jgi:hypothetical protein
MTNGSLRVWYNARFDYGGFTMKAFRMLALLVLGGLTWACSSSDTTQKCDSPLECDQAYTCIEGKCAQMECTAYEDCPGEDETCLLGADPEQPELKFCTPVQCNAKTPCEAGFECNEFYQCVAVGGDITEGDVVATDVAQTEVTEDSTEPPAQDSSCKACSSDADCDGQKCYPLGGGTYCFGQCTTHDDCPSGWMCYQLDNQSMQCIPMAFNCDAGCLSTGCPEGQVCNQESGECQPGGAECAACQQDWDCGDGLKCYNQGKYCAPACAGGCPGNSACQEVNSIAVNLCVSGTAVCCYGDACANPCQAPTPYPLEGTCVECVEDAHCGEGKYCEQLSHSCMDAACQPPTPFQLDDGSCVECKNTSHCAAKGAGYVCDPATHTCKTDDKPEECSYCQDPYPACTEINGIWSCVQCTDDSYCPNGTCDLSLYSCSGGVNGPGCGSCSSDSDCVSAMGDKVLACDVASGCCYDTGGFCDNVESMCNAGAGSDCMGLMEMLMGGMGGIPGMPEGMAGGVCTCDEPVGMDGLLCLIIPGGMFPCPEGGGCLGDSICVDPAAIPLLGDIMGALGGASGICLSPGILSGILPI